MYGYRRLFRYPLCLVGCHVQPTPRHPHGPVVADCACCGKTCYFFGLSLYGLHGLAGPPVLTSYTIKAVVRAPG